MAKKKRGRPIRPFSAISTGNPSVLPITMPIRPTRKRYAQLAKIVVELLDWLETKGIKKEEGCDLRILIEHMWSMKKGE